LPDWFLFPCPLTSRYADGGTPPRTAKAEIESVYLEARNTPNLELLDSIYVQDVIVHGSSGPDILGLDALKVDYQVSHTGFPDFRMQIDEAFWSEDRLVLFWTVQGTHTGHLLGVPPTSRSVTLSGVAIDRIEAGLIVEEWVYFNLLDLMEQLGMQVVPGEAAGQTG
jgi:steroid delta-isomerase-like uncharacterized protein